MQKEGTWDIGESKLRYFREGDACLLCFVDGEPAGYTWAHFNGHPLLQPGLRIKVPENYLYNYAGFTPPKFRGLKLQPYRHYALMNQESCRDKEGLIGYVKYANWSSRRGQNKSGYRSIGKMWLLGTKKKFFVFLSKELRKRGIKRV